MTNDLSKSKATGRSGELIPPELGKRPENRIQPPDQRPDRHNEVREPIFGAGAGSFLGQLIITALGGVDTYRIHKTMAARVTTAR